jgi:hypothetical protein
MPQQQHLATAECQALGLAAWRLAASCSHTHNEGSNFTIIVLPLDPDKPIDTMTYHSAACCSAHAHLFFLMQAQRCHTYRILDCAVRITDLCIVQKLHQAASTLQHLTD